MGKRLLTLLVIVLAIFLSGDLFSQKIPAKDLFVLSPEERKLFDPPYTHTWGSNFEDFPLKNLWEAFDQGKPPVPLDPNVGDKQGWYDPNGGGSQNHSLLWQGEAVIAYALKGDVANYEKAAQNCIKLLDLNFDQGHMRHEAIGGYTSFWEGGIAAMALGGLYAPAGSTSGPLLLKKARRWWTDHMAVLNALRMPDGQVARLGARCNHGESGDYDEENITVAVNLQLISPQAYNTLHPWIAALVTKDGKPSYGNGGDYKVHWHHPRHVSNRWVVLRAVQSGAIQPALSASPSPKVVDDIYRWTSGNRTYVAAPSIVGLPRCRYKMSWAPGEWVRIEIADPIGTTGGRGLPNGHLPPQPVNIPSNADLVLGPAGLTSKSGGTTVVPCSNCTNDAVFVSQQVPSTIEVGKAATVTVIMKNTGTSTWTNSGTNPYRLGSENPVDNKRWNSGRVDLLVASVAPGSQATFKFTITAPSVPGTYNFQWKMVHEGKEWFGALSTNMQITVTSPYQGDAAILSVVEPFKKGCETDVAPKVVIQNSGTVLITDLVLDYQIDKDPVQSKTFTNAGGLSVGNTITLELNQSSLKTGNHQMKIWVKEVNKIADTNHGNDTVAGGFEVISSGGLLPFKEDFETTGAGSVPQDWSVYNPDASNQWFVFAGNGNKAIAMNNRGYDGASDEQDEFLLPVLDLTSVSNPALTFDVCHASMPGALVHDSLAVMISTDCGQSFTSLWGKGGPGLNTVADDSSTFIPQGVQDYRKEFIDLANYSTDGNVLIKFVNWSNNGNSTLVDNINIAEAVTSSINELKIPNDLKVYPNPGTGLITVEVPAALDGINTELRIFDLHGKLIRQLPVNTDPSFRLDLTDVQTGLYLVELSSPTHRVLQRIQVVR